MAVTRSHVDSWDQYWHQEMGWTLFIKPLSLDSQETSWKEYFEKKFSYLNYWKHPSSIFRHDHFICQALEFIPEARILQLYSRLIVRDLGDGGSTLWHTTEQMLWHCHGHCWDKTTTDTGWCQDSAVILQLSLHIIHLSLLCADVADRFTTISEMFAVG